MFQALLARRPANLKDDLLSGLTVALALVPEAVAFALIAGVPVMVGLHAAFLMGLLAAVFGGRPGMISGATGAMAVVLIGLSDTVHQHYGIDESAPFLGAVVLEHIFLAVGLAGIIQIACGIGRLGKFIRMVPHSVMLGFVNGLAIVIFLAQFGSFKDANGQLLGTTPLLWMGGLALLTMAVIAIVPRITKAVPAPLVGIGITTALVLTLGIDTTLLKGMPGWELGDLSFWERLPLPHWPGYDADTVAAAAATGIELPSIWSLDGLVVALPFAIVLAAVGLIESLMTMSVIDEITETRGRGNRECIGQGIGNLVCGGFAAMGGCAMIGQSMININSGGRGRLSGISAAVLLLVFMLFAADWIGMIPLAALTGVMFMVVIATFEWGSLRILHQVPKSDALVIITVPVVTIVTHNLALAVLIGVIAAALVFAWKQATAIHAHIDDDENGRTYRVQGMLFFASVSRFRDLFDPTNDPDQVALDFADAKVADHSGIEALSALAERYEKAGKRIHLRHLSPECTELLGKAKRIVDVDALTDPHYHVADDALA